MALSEPRTAPLHELIEIKHGFAFKSEYFVSHATNSALVTPGNFAIGGGFRLVKPKYYEGPIPPEFVLSPDDLLVTMTDLSKGGDTLGYPARVPYLRDLQLLHNQRVGKVLIKPRAQLHPGFLYYALCTSAYRSRVLATATGSTVRHTSPTRICEIQIPLPPIGDQLRIAGVLGALDAKIACSLTLASRLEQLATALFEAALAEGPVEQTTLGEMGVIGGGGTPKSGVSEYWFPEEVLWLTPTDMTALEVPVVLSTKRKISNLGLNNSSAKLVPAGSVLMTSRATVGLTAIAGIALSMNQGFITLQPHAHLSSPLVLFAMRSVMSQVHALAGGSTFPEINKTNFKGIPVVVPAGEAGENFDQAARPIFALIAEQARAVSHLRTIRGELVPKLISGKVRVAESYLADVDEPVAV